MLRAAEHGSPSVKHSKLTNAARATADAIQRHGGGLQGLYSVTIRSFRVLSALGWRGLARRVEAASRAVPLADDASAGEPLPQPVPLDAITLRVCVVLHVHYPDLLGQFHESLARIPTPFSLLVSVNDASVRELVVQALSSLPLVRTLDIRVVENRGRDIAPMVVDFRNAILEHDVVCHVHTKKSLRTGAEQDGWRDYLLTSLLGSGKRVEWIIGMFQAMPTLGLVYPESHHAMPLAGHTWLGNLEPARMLGERLDIRIDAGEYLDFPAGSMFWAKVDAIRPLLELDLATTDFPEELGQADGTLQHAIERMLGKVVQHSGYRRGVMPASGDLTLSHSGSRNWHRALFPTAGDWIQARSAEADIISFDIFDTLVTRTFLTPEGARQYLAHRVEQEYGISGFDRLRSTAETLARTRVHAGDVGLAQIYAVVGELLPDEFPPSSALMALELAIEKQQLRPRQRLVQVMQGLIGLKKRVVAISDMYLDRTQLEQVVPPGVLRGLEAIHVSCESGRRKDTGEAWRTLPADLGIPAGSWLHVGDNEHSDVLLPQRMGYMQPVHVLRPSALLGAVPALQPLLPSGGATAHWSEQLVLGLLANRFSDLADATPEAFGQTIRLEDPGMVGHTVFGPLILDYLAWTARMSLSRRAGKILFLSREGYLFNRAFELLKNACPELSDVQGHYLLASRRSTGVASLREWADVDRLLQGSFNGSLGQLVLARFGQTMASAIESALGPVTMRSPVFLPEMQQAIKDRLQPASTLMLEVAAQERDCYLRYWQETVGDSQVLLSDVGYGGTIQTHLAHLLQRDLHGAYLALDERARQVALHGGSAQGRYFDARTGLNSSACPVLDHNLLLEAVLTAPTGQFSHFIEDQSGKLFPQYVESGSTNNAVVERIQAGALEFMRDAIAAVGPDIICVDLSNKIAQQPLAQLAAGQWSMAGATGALSVEDQFSGRGHVQHNRPPEAGPAH